MIGHTDSRKASIAVIIGAIGLVSFSMAKPVSDAGCIVFARDGCIWVMSADGGSERQLTFGGKDGTPAWSPDGEQIAFCRSIDDTSLGDIYVMNADGANLKQVTSGPEHDNSPTWSPNGRQIAFSRQIWEKIREGEWEQRSAAIYVMDADGSDVRRLTVEDPFFFSWSVDWSSDGAMIVFHQYNSRTGNRIWVMNADGSSQKLLLEWGDDPACCTPSS